MTQFHEGQDVEVLKLNDEVESYWRKAKIVLAPLAWTVDTLHEVQFPDGTRDVFDAEHIRAAKFDLQNEWNDTMKKLRDAGAIP